MGGGATMSRKVWTVDELLNILKAVARMGGDAKTLTAIAEALGIRLED
jgi:hypothetical protein